jgi:hypothetical protein
MISLMLSLFLLLPASIMANSTTSTSRQTPFFNRLRKRNRVPSKTNQFDPFLQARALTPKEHGFDMPSFLKYGSTGRPPGKFHLRHSLKDLTYNLEFSYPPLDIFFIEITNNNNNNINYIDNGGSGTDGYTNDIAVPVAVGNNTNVVGHRSNQIAAAGLSEWFVNRFESNRCNYNYEYKSNIDGISTTTTTAATPAPTTINYKTSTEGIPNEEGEAGLSVWSTDQTESNRWKCKCKFKFNIDGNSTSTSTTTTTATINDKTSAEGISNEGGEEAEATAAGLLEWFANLLESKRCNSISNNNNNNRGSISTSTSTTNKDYYNETFHHFFLFKLISLYLIITKSFLPKEFKTAMKEKQQQEHYHAKDRHQFHLEQQQKHQHFKQEQHNMERMVTSIVLKLTLVAWDMWTYRNGF